MVVVSLEYQFLYAEVGMNERNSDGGAWAQSSMRKALENNILNLPKPTSLSGGLNDIPFVCVRDDAIPLPKYMIKAYP